MIELVVAAAAFVASHVALSSTPARGALAARIGERGFLAAYSLLSVVLIVWMAHAYAAAPEIAVWPSTTFFRHLGGAVMVAAAILVAGGVASRNPTAVGGARGFASDAPVPGFLAITRHPVMWGIGLWGVVHVLANGDAASIVFFGAFAALAFGGTVLIDRKRAATMGDAWSAFAAGTSNVPFAAVVAGRARLAAGGVGLWRVALGIGLYFVLLFGHEPVIGVWPLGVGGG